MTVAHPPRRSQDDRSVAPVLRRGAPLGRCAERQAERDWLPASDWRTMIFAGKEAIYKAINPDRGEFLGFSDVELDIDPAAGEFRARCRRDLGSAVPVAAGRGYWAVCRAHWLVIFVIPRDAHPTASSSIIG